MDLSSFLLILMLVAPLLSSGLVFLAPVVANAIARREGRQAPMAAGWTSLLGPGLGVISAVVLIVALRGGGALTMWIGLSAQRAVEVVLTRADLAAILTVAVAGAALNGALLWGRVGRPSLYSAALLVQSAAVVLLMNEALWPLAVAAGGLAALAGLGGLLSWRLGRVRATA